MAVVSTWSSCGGQYTEEIPCKQTREIRTKEKSLGSPFVKPDRTHITEIKTKGNINRNANLTSAASREAVTEERGTGSLAGFHLRTTVPGI